MGDASYVKTRWKADPGAAFAAEVNGKLIGSNFASNWGSVGFFGPLTVHPDYWDQGAAKLLLEPVMECFAKWGTKHAGLFTFSQSTKHVNLYQKFGFWPRFLTSIMAKPVEQANHQLQWSKFSEVPEGEQESTLLTCRQLTDAIYEGLDVTAEIQSVAEQGLGETVLLWENGKLVGLAVCHYGPGTEAGSGTCYIKFGAVRSGANAGQDFNSLLKACEKMATEKGLQKILAGVNTARYEAYQHLLNSGFRTQIQGVAMSRPNESGYNRPGVYLIDDWR
ncbi:GNAT family N-acetyltransferase [Flavihumibacter solisilvae]|uniref:GNAT family N-acetyltransferase n=1 Tax=Flavihumibacter solisilvae TaxID=1349421 RepID=UPI0009E24CEA|nr:GNAT family N-acetyltransferase [Flavihumibacter solisilvae]